MTKPKRRFFLPLVAAAIISAVLFAAGLASGLYANKVIAARQAEDSAFLLENVENIERELQSYQLQERLIDSLSEEQGCAFADIYFDRTIQGLNDFWDVLPDRLEEYERDHTLTEDYVALKERYITASLRTWIIARKNYHLCGNEPIPLLYFYSRTCESCVEQGKALDGARDAFAEQNRSLVIFTIDTDADVPAIALIKDYYAITEVPALIVGNGTRQGSVLDTDEIIPFVMHEAAKQ